MHVMIRSQVRDTSVAVSMELAPALASRARMRFAADAHGEILGGERPVRLREWDFSDTADIVRMHP